VHVDGLFLGLMGIELGGWGALADVGVDSPDLKTVLIWIMPRNGPPCTKGYVVWRWDLPCRFSWANRALTE
jgi:hypothetical protein